MSSEFQGSSPFFSICIAAKNAGLLINKCLESVLSQDYRNFELLIYDAVSDDGTAGVVLKFGDSRVVFKSEPDGGIADAWNKAVQVARGEWIIFLGADDELASKFVLSGASKVLDKDGGLVWVGGVEYVNELGRVVRKIFPVWDPEKFRRYGMSFCHQGVFHHRSLFELHGGFDQSFKIAADYEMLLRYLRAENAKLIHGFVVAKVGDGGISGADKYSLRVMKEYALAKRRHGIKSSLQFYVQKSICAVKFLIVSVLGVRVGGAIIDRLRPFAGRVRRGA